MSYYYFLNNYYILLRHFDLNTIRIYNTSTFILFKALQSLNIQRYIHGRIYYQGIFIKFQVTHGADKYLTLKYRNNYI